MGHRKGRTSGNIARAWVQILMIGRQAHWDHIYDTKAGNELSWFQNHPAIPHVNLGDRSR
jgi:hypothetical protein